MPPKHKKYDVMVRVNFSYENMSGDIRNAWATWIGNCKSSDPTTIPNWIATEIIKFNPGEPVARIIFSEIASHTIIEVDNV